MTTGVALFDASTPAAATLVPGKVQTAATVTGR